MDKSFYDALARLFETDKKKKQLLLTANKILTWIFYVVYPLLLLALLWQRDSRLLRLLLVPAVSFLAVTLFRKAVGARRPYEVWDAPPLIPKDTRGNSFPSRHVFSVFMLSMAAGYLWLPALIPLFVCGLLLAAVRVIARIHFVRDVLAGALIGILLGLIGFWVL